MGTKGRKYMLYIIVKYIYTYIRIFVEIRRESELVRINGVKKKISIYC